MSDPADTLEMEEPKESSIVSLLRGLVRHRASDLHIKVGRPPLYRINGKIVAAKLPALNADTVKSLAYSTMTSKQIEYFETNLQIDFGYALLGLARFRANVFMQKGAIAIVVRIVPFEIPLISSLGLPAIAQELALKPRGLILVTGPTGAGKSTTLAAMVEHINRNMRAHIITIEDPIEFIFEDKSSTISQREVGADATSMPQALRGALRQDPDVIVVGEMRDYETMQTALSAAETGHLVISTLHTNSAAQSIDRILDSFPAAAKNQVRMQLASSLLAVISQRLIRKANVDERVLAAEILIKSPTVEKLILENKLNEINGVIESSNLYYKMQSFNQSLEALVRSGAISLAEAMLHSDRKEELDLKLSGVIGGGQRGVEAAEFMEQAAEGTRQMKRTNKKNPAIDPATIVPEEIDAPEPTLSGLSLDDTLGKANEENYKGGKKKKIA